VAPVDLPGAAFTFPGDINNHGQIVGDGDGRGFVTQDVVNFTPLLFPGASATFPSGINDHGHIVGIYRVGGSLIDHGFLYVQGTWTMIDYPGSQSTLPAKINCDGTIVGSYSLGDRSFAFVRDKLGVWTTIDTPGTAFAFASGIDDSGRIVGGFGSLDATHGFVKAGTTVTTIDYPGQLFTELSDINNAGEIIGMFNSSFTQVAGRFIARGCLSPTMTVTANATIFHPGELLEIDVTVANPGESVAVDVYFGVMLPSAAGPGLGCPNGDAVAFITPGSGQVTCLSAPPQNIPPYARNVTLPGALPSTTLSDFFSYAWGTTEPAGAYTFFLALTPVGAFADRQIGPSDRLLLALKRSRSIRGRERFTAAKMDAAGCRWA
jgi:hypothetical protein